jgi:type IV secretory pathway VirB4 component
MRLHTLPRLQVGAMQKNSPLFIGNSLNKYVDYHIGVMLPTLTGAALWPFFYDSIDDKYGTFIGVEANTGGKIIFDQFAYLNDTENAKAQGRTAGNMLVIGKTGMGKTVFMTLLICSHIINHRKVIWLDPENKNKELTRKLEGNYIEVGLNKNVINIFDLQPVSTDADEKESEEVMYDTKIAIKNVVEDVIVMFKTLWPNITEDEINVLDEITEKTYRVVGIDGTESFRYLKPEDYPTFTTFSVVIDQMLEEYENSSLKNKKVIEALLNLQMKMRSLVGTAGIEGHLSRYFNGTTNINMDSLDTIGLVSFGTKHLMNTPEHIRNALLRIIFKYAWSNCLSTDEQTVFVTDEDHTYIQNEPIAALKAQFQRRARKYNTVTISGTQEVKDYNNDRIQVHGAAIFNNATYRVYFNMELDGIVELGKLVHLTDQEMDTIRFLLPHYCLFENGNRKIPVHILMSEREKEFFGA